MTNYTYDEVLSQIQLLTPDEQLRLLEDLAAMIRQELTIQRKHNVMEFSGFAKELWKDVDVEKYIDEERNSWDR